MHNERLYNLMTVTDKIFICPLCRAPLYRDSKSWFCSGERRHCYDVSSAGYVNLLPPGKASNAKTGDDKGMLTSRRDFLNAGYYKKISEKAAELILDASEKDSITFIDAGAGEGYHTLNILKVLEEAGRSSFAVGLEASKHGALLAAKRAKNMNNAVFAAANIFDMPISDGCADAAVSMFAPISDSESARILKDDGVLVVCSSGSRHLWEMRQILYGKPRLSDPLSRVPERFKLFGHSEVKYGITVSSQEEIHALFEMTPFYYRCPKEGRERLASLDKLETRVEVEYNLYKKI